MMLLTALQTGCGSQECHMHNLLHLSMANLSAHGSYHGGLGNFKVVHIVASSTCTRPVHMLCGLQLEL